MGALACLDMAGTTIIDDGLVVDAFAAALDELGHPMDEATQDLVNATMGQSKVEVFARLLGSRQAAQQAAAAFERAYEGLVQDRGARLIPGALHALAELRAGGMSICLTTGFSPVTRDLLVQACGLRDHIDLALSPADTANGRGRPAPDMILTALMATCTDSVAQVLVVGDTASDMASGVAAGAGHVIGVLTGVHGMAELLAAGAHQVIASVADLPAALQAGWPPPQPSRA